ncbi:MAG: AMP-binding protein [Planctomycetes bacterium]|nr:AMP-binding protein [Planctomycetota bacterium]
MRGIPIRDCTVSGLLRRATALFPEREAVVSPERGVRWTFRRLDEEADRVAAACVAAGLAPGDRAVVWACNIPEWLALQYGLARAGAVLVTANTALKLPEIVYILQKSRARASSSPTTRCRRASSSSTSSP